MKEEREKRGERRKRVRDKNMKEEIEKEIKHERRKREKG